MLEVRELSKSFGGVKAIDSVSLQFPAGSLTAIIGPNGAGKSTFFNLLSGGLQPDRGQVILDGNDLVGASRKRIIQAGVGRAFQIVRIFPSLTVEQTLHAAVNAHQGHSARLFGRFPSAQAQPRVDEIAEMLGLEDSLQEIAANLSHGDQKLLDVALALALQPRVLLLDEPTAGMGVEDRWRMMERIQALWARERLTLVFIEHDMDIVFGIAPRICVLSYGGLIAEGTPDQIRADQAVIDAYLGTGHYDGQALEQTEGPEASDAQRAAGHPGDDR